jgi:hypothetical protein
MSAKLIPFPARHAKACTPPHPYNFWYPLLESMPPELRAATIVRAFQYGVIDHEDAYIFATSWEDMPPIALPPPDLGEAG